jgi:hypothetical protein
MKSRGRLVARFWDNEESRQPGATQEQIAGTEAIIGYPLPDGLRELLLLRNGGLSNFSAFRRVGEDDYPLFPMFSADPCGDFDSLVSAFGVRGEFDVPDGVVPFSGQGRSWWGLDYRVVNGPGVVFKWDEEELVLVASSFDGFLVGLVEDWLGE